MVRGLNRFITLNCLFVAAAALTIPCSSCLAQLPPAPAAQIDVGHISSQESSLSLMKLQSLALTHHPTLSAARARLSAARGKQKQAGLYPNPTIGYHSTVMGNFGTSGMQGGFVGQKFITGGKLDLDQQIASKEIDEAQFRWLAQERRVLNDIEIRFYEALAAQQRVELTRELVRIGRELVTATKTLVAGRQKSENDLLQAEIRAEDAQILHDNASNEWRAAQRRLAAVVGVANLSCDKLDGQLENKLPDFSWEDCQGILLASHPEVNAAKMRSERARIATQRAQREPIPDINTWVSIRHNNINDDEVANVQVGIPLPVFDRNQGNIAAAEANWIAAYKDMERVELNLQDRLAVAYRQYANARHQAERYSQQILPRAERSLTLVTNGYKQGQVEYLTLLLSQQTYVEVNLSYIKSLEALRTASVLIEGQLLAGSLNPSP